MKIVQLQQGTPEWQAHRAQHWNASDAPAMMGCSPYKTRSQLLAELATGVAPEVDAMTQRRFDDGHRSEALARPLAEKIVGEELYPVVGVEGQYSASFDGITLGGEICFEHKRLNDDLRVAIRQQGGNANDFLPLMYRVQMEHQLLVSEAERELFMASKWEGETLVEERHCWYTPDLALRAQIVAGWEQFERDLAAYTPPAAAPVVVAAAVQSLPSVVVQVTGEIAIKDNFAAFQVKLQEFLDHHLIREPKSDQDFATLDLQIKAMKGAEAALDSAEAQMLAQIQTVDSAKRTKDMLAKLVRDNRLMAEKLLASEKERRRGEIVAGGVAALRDHITSLNTRLGQAYMPAVPADFASAIKGLKSLASMEDRVATELARAKIEANRIADGIQANLALFGTVRNTAMFKAIPDLFGMLFMDVAQLVLKAPDDCAAVIAARVAAEEKRRDAERERIRLEEVARLEREAKEAHARQVAEEQASAVRDTVAALQAAAAEQPAPNALTIPAPTPAPAVVHLAARRPPPVANEPATLNIGAISQRLGFTVSAAFLADTLGIAPAATDKAAKLYRESQFPLICSALVNHISAMQRQHAA